MSSSQLLIVGTVILAAVLLMIGFVFGRKPSAPKPISLEVWGVVDDESVWLEIIRQFEKTYPHQSVSYRRFPEEDYEEILINRLAEGKGPDIFFLKNSWITKHRDKIAPLPQSKIKFSVKDFQEQFVDIAADELIAARNEIIGIPLYVDTLALYYNKDIFNTAGIAVPPRDWDELVEISRILTKPAAVSGIERSGISLGTSRNVEHALEILSAMAMQEGDLAAELPSGSLKVDAGMTSALERYVSFANPRHLNFSWNERRPNSLDAFAEGGVAMVIGFAEDKKKIAAKNPHLNFGIARLPQPRNRLTALTYGRYFFPAVSQRSRSLEAGWNFLLFAASRESALTYLEKSGRPPARRDIIKEKAATPEDELFAQQALAARGWPIPDERATQKIFQETIDSSSSGLELPSQSVRKLMDKLNLLLP